MTPAGRRRGAVAALILAGALVLTGKAPAAAQEPCTALFNGVEAERVASLSSPLVLEADDTLDFSGIDEAGTAQASVSLLLGPLTMGEAASSRATAVPEFAVSLDLSDVASRSVGLLRVQATTDNCTVEAWLRVGGRLPLTTSAGLAGIGLTVAGLAWLGAALVVRRGWSAWVAAACGFFTGTGVALLVQQFGRLQVSYWSLGGCAALAAAVGLAAALLLRWKVRPGEAPAPAQAPLPAPATRPGPSPAPAPAAQPGPAPAVQATPDPPQPEAPAERRAPVSRPPAPPAPPAPPESMTPFWGYVLADLEVLHLEDYSRVVGTLHPGTWYLVSREMSGWARVEAAPGVEGWVPRRALHRED
jgi:hypothetical protein